MDCPGSSPGQAPQGRNDSLKAHALPSRDRWCPVGDRNKGVVAAWIGLGQCAHCALRD